MYQPVDRDIVLNAHNASLQFDIERRQLIGKFIVNDLGNNTSKGLIVIVVSSLLRYLPRPFSS